MTARVLDVVLFDPSACSCAEMGLSGTHDQWFFYFLSHATKRTNVLSTKKRKRGCVSGLVVSAAECDGGGVFVYCSQPKGIYHAFYFDMLYEYEGPQVPPPVSWQLDVEVVQGDCVEVLQNMGDRSFQVAIFSPPYNAFGSNRHYGSAEYCGAYLPEDDYVSKLVSLFRVLEGKVDGPVIMNLSYFTSNQQLMMKAVTAICQGTNWKSLPPLFWVKPQAQTLPGRALTPLAEYLWVFECTPGTGSPVQGFEWYERLGWDRISCNLVRTSSCRDLERQAEARQFGYENNATFPSELVQKLLATYGVPGTRVLDPFAGSGTVGKVCLPAGMHFTGIDLSKKACAWMVRDLQAGVRQAGVHKQDWVDTLATFLGNHYDEGKKEFRGLWKQQ